MTGERRGVGCHGRAKGSKAARVVPRASMVEAAGSRRRAAGIRVEGTHGPTKGSRVTEIGEGGGIPVVVVCGGTRSELSTGAS